jgi:hypothetical protein
MDVKRLARFSEPGHAATGERHDRSRGAGWEYLHVVIDDHSRLAYVEPHPQESAETMLGPWSGRSPGLPPWVSIRPRR